VSIYLICGFPDRNESMTHSHKIDLIAMLEALRKLLAYANAEPALQLFLPDHPAIRPLATKFVPKEQRHFVNSWREVPGEVTVVVIGGTDRELQALESIPQEKIVRVFPIATTGGAAQSALKSMRGFIDAKTVKVLSDGFSIT